MSTFSFYETMTVYFDNEVQHLSLSFFVLCDYLLMLFTCLVLLPVWGFFYVGVFSPRFSFLFMCITHLSDFCVA